MSINKNFVIRHGLEVDTSLILANADTNKVGIALTDPNYTLHVNGGIGATNLVISGVATLPSIVSSNLQANSAYINSGIVTSLTASSANITSLTGSDLNYSSGNSNLGVTTVTNLTSQNISVSGITTCLLVDMLILEELLEKMDKF
jgi:hypothetical protein